MINVSIFYRLYFFLLVFFSHHYCNGTELPKLPILGYNSYDHVGCCPSEELIKEVADAMVSTGLAKLGYKYIGIDCGWAEKKRTNNTNEVTWRKDLFPSGIPHLAKYLHDKELKLGIYSDRGEGMFYGGPGMYKHEQQDAFTFAKWGIDLLKVDDMTAHSHRPEDARKDYLTIRNALHNATKLTGQEIHYVTCGHSNNNSYPPSWERSWMGEECVDIANACRVSEDVRFWGNGSFGTNKAINIIAELNKRGLNGRNGSWADPDMLFSYTPPPKYCAGGFSDSHNWTARTAFSLWAIMPAPILISTNIGNLTKNQLETYSNAEVLAVHQDPLGKLGIRLYGGNLSQYDYKKPTTPPDVDNVTPTNIWGRELTDGGWAVIFINDGPIPTNIICRYDCLEAMGLQNKTISVRDLWLHQHIGTITIDNPYFTVHNVHEKGGSVLVKMKVEEG